VSNVSAVAVKSVTGLATAVGVWTAIIGAVSVVVTAYIRQWGPWKKVANDREANLLDERAEDMANMRARISKLEEKLEYKEALHQAERAVDRHRINNLDQCLTAFLLMVKRAPEDAATAAALIEDMRAQQVAREKDEATAIHAAVIAATKPGASE
jgi:hypothetical protein